MAVPWLRILDSALGVADMALGGGRRSAAANAERQARGAESGALEARLVGVVLAALKEAFNRDHERLELERDQIEAARQRADRALQLEVRRQAGDREIARLRLIAGVAVAGLLGTLFFSARWIAGGVPGRMALGLGWMLLLGATAASFAAEARISRILSAGPEQSRPEPVAAGAGGAAAPWLVVAGLAVVAIGALTL